MNGEATEGERALRDEVIQLRAKLEELRGHLEEPQEIIRAIRQGEVDSFVVTDPRGERIYSLRSADVLYRSMVEEMKEGAIALEPSGLIVYANRYFATLMKTDREALVGTSVFPFVPEESRPFFDALGQAGAGGETGRKELVLRASDGGLVPVGATMNRIDLDDDSVFCLIVSDLTSERRREELLTESRRKDEFLAMLAHELRNPIAPIRNAVQVMDLSNSTEPKVRWAQEVIERQVIQLGRLVDDLLDVSRITRGKIRLDLHSVDLGSAINRGIETAQPAIEARGHQLTVELPPVPLRAMGDETRLSQVISNILHNAAKFTPEGGSIWVRLERQGSEARITVSDSGVGIRPEMLSKIFDLFTQADSTLERSQGGLGIGLALVRNLVEMHGGHVEVRSDGPDRGSEFTVSLPLLADASPAEEAASPATESRPAVAPLRVLVVDDNLDSAESLTVLVEELGNEVRMETEGGKVLEAAREFRPHLILLDISLPDISGFDVAEELRRQPDLADVCLVALSGYGQEHHRRRSSEVGFDRYWVKPVDLVALKSVLAGLSLRVPDAPSSRS